MIIIDEKNLNNEIYQKDLYLNIFDSILIDKISNNDLVDFIVGIFDGYEEDKTAIVGIDIYKYSSKELYEQAMTPFVFDLLKHTTYEVIKINCKYIFSKFNFNNEERNNKFISTGDGGFFVFDNPIQSLLFIIYFQTVVRLFNSKRINPKLSKFIGEIDLRYVMTLDRLYQYNNNYFGKAIINCSRILSKDKLNRFLIDKNTYNWFLERFGGIDNIINLKLEDLTKYSEFDGYDLNLLKLKNEIIYSKESSVNNEGIFCIDVQKIDDITQKGNELSLYNIHLQANMVFEDNNKNLQKYFLSVGNLNSEGLK